MLSTTLSLLALLPVLLAGPVCLPASGSGSGGVAIHPNGNNGVCLDVAGNVRANGTPVQAWSCNGSGAQKWVINPGSGAVKLAGTNFCLDAGSYPGNGIKLKIWQCYDGLAAQTWNLSNDNRISTQGQCVDLTDGRTSNGNVLQTWQCAAGNTNQVWTTDCVAGGSTGGNSGNSGNNNNASPPANNNPPPPANNGNKAPLTPNGIKAGLAGGTPYDIFVQYNLIGWWYDWTCPLLWHSGKPVPVPMLWGDGHRGGLQNDQPRFSDCQKYYFNSNAQKAAPPYFLGFNEPDCPGGDSSDLSPERAAAVWNQYIAPLSAKGTLLVSPALCRQDVETFLTPFSQKINVPFDIVAVHVYQPDLASVQRVINHYRQYGKPLWITEFGCVLDPANGFQSPWDQGTINNFISQVVPWFQSQPDIYAYAFVDVNNGWKMNNGDGSLTATGQHYLNTLRQVQGK